MDRNNTLVRITVIFTNNTKYHVSELRTFFSTEALYGVDDIELRAELLNLLNVKVLKPFKKDPIKCVVITDNQGGAFCSCDFENKSIAEWLAQKHNRLRAYYFTLTIKDKKGKSEEVSFITEVNTDYLYATQREIRNHIKVCIKKDREDKIFDGKLTFEGRVTRIKVEKVDAENHWYTVREIPLLKRDWLHYDMPECKTCDDITKIEKKVTIEDNHLMIVYTCPECGKEMKHRLDNSFIMFQTTSGVSCQPNSNVYYGKIMDIDWAYKNIKNISNKWIDDYAKYSKTFFNLDGTPIDDSFEF